MGIGKALWENGKMPTCICPPEALQTLDINNNQIPLNKLYKTGKGRGGCLREISFVFNS